MSRAGLFLDRDGVVIRDVDLMTDAADVEILPGVPAAVARARAAGLAIVVVTNQAVVARGLCDEAAVDAVHRAIDTALIDAGAGAVDLYRFCPHHPHANVERYRVVCECRKPRPGMLLDAATTLDLDLTRSVMIGDRPTDVLAGHRAGATTVLIEGATADAPLIVGVNADDLVEPDHRATDLTGAIDWWLARAAS